MLKRKNEADDTKPRKQRQTLDVALQMVHDNKGKLTGLTESKKEARQVLMLSMQLMSPPRFKFPEKFVCDKKFVFEYLFCGGQFGWSTGFNGVLFYHGLEKNNIVIDRHFEDIEFVHKLLKRKQKYIAEPDTIIYLILNQRRRYEAQWMDLIQKMLEYSQGGLITFLVKMHYIREQNVEAMMEEAVWIQPSNILLVPARKWTPHMVANALLEGSYSMTAIIMRAIPKYIFKKNSYVQVITDFLDMQKCSWFFDFFQLDETMEFESGYEMRISEFMSYYVRLFCETNRGERLHSMICSEDICGDDHSIQFIQWQIQRDPLLFLCNERHWKDRTLWFCAVAPMIHLVTSTYHQRQVRMEDVSFKW